MRREALFTRARRGGEASRAVEGPDARAFARHLVLLGAFAVAVVQQLAPLRFDHRLEPARDPELAQDVRDMALDGARADSQTALDQLVRQALAEQGEHFDLPTRQHLALTVMVRDERRKAQ